MTNQGHLEISVAQSARQNESTNILDKAFVSFNEGSVLPKFHFGNHAEVSIPLDHEEYAIVCSEQQSEMPLNFKAKKYGTYTLTVHPEAVKMGYLHLIDNFTPADIDLLATPSYTFKARSTDAANRFTLVFNANENENDNENFAFIHNGQIILTGMDACVAYLQIIDMLGHVILTREVTPHSSLPTPNSPGVYVLRLINGDVVWTQKIVIP